jgi:tetratricopeptide (TPR) repeat protein
VEGDDSMAIHTLGCKHSVGNMGLPQDYNKAVELWLRAGELGCVEAYCNVGNAYYTGRGVESDAKKANHYWELAAMRGVVDARYNLGVNEERAGNYDRAVKHFMISAIAGDDDSLEKIRKCYLNGWATKDDFEKALRAHKEAKDGMRSDQRDAAVGFMVKSIFDPSTVMSSFVR